jgi:hypothetical protein
MDPQDLLKYLSDEMDESLDWPFAVPEQGNPNSFSARYSNYWCLEGCNTIPTLFIHDEKTDTHFKLIPLEAKENTCDQQTETEEEA